MRRLVLFLLSAILLTTAVTTGVTGVSSASSSAAAAPAGTTPNIVLISTDDQAAADMEYMPYTRDLIGGHGTTFTDALSAYPLCCPARASILTGMLNHNNGVRSNKPPYGGYPALRDGPYNDKTLPVWLQKAGYETTFVGKYLNNFSRTDATPPGWDDFTAPAELGGVYDYYGEKVVFHNGDLVNMDGQYQADITQDVTEQRISTAVQDGKPFFVWQADLAPHGACYPTDGGKCTWGPPMPAKEDADKFGTAPFTDMLDPSFNERVVSDKPAAIQALPRLSDARIRSMSAYHRDRIRSLQAVDRNVRDTVALLDSLGQLDNTLFIFTTDNGYMMGEHRYTGKVLGYEPSLRVPLLMRGPGIPVGKTVSSTVALVDIAPTIAQVAQAQPEITQDGRSVIGVANGTEPGYDAISVEAGPQTDAEGDGWLYQGVRTKRYTYLEYPTTKERELYDRKVDPYELNNVAYRPTYRDTRTALAGMLSKLRACAGEQCRSVGGPVPPPVSDGTPIHPDELGSIGTGTQVVTLTAPTWSSPQGTAVAWQKSGHTWRIARGPFPVTLGTNGMVHPGKARQLTGKVPAGSFRPSSAFGLNPDPGTTLRYRQFDENDYWPYDPASKSTYNVLQRSRSGKATWRSSLAERWWDHRFRYPSALIVDQNLPSGITWSTRFHERVAAEPADTTQGSFVIHSGAAIGKNGWVSMRPAQVRWLLDWMRPVAQGTRLVVGTPTYLRANL